MSIMSCVLPCPWSPGDPGTSQELSTMLRSRSTQPQFSSVVQSCPAHCNHMDCSTPGLPVHHQFPEFTQTHVHWVHDAIQPSHPLSPGSPPTLILTQHQGLFQSQLFVSGGQSTGASASASVLPVNSQSWFPLGLTGWISLLSKELSIVFYYWAAASESCPGRHQEPSVLRQLGAWPSWMNELGLVSLLHSGAWVQGARFHTSMVLEKTLESPLDCKEIQPVHPKGNQPWVFIGRTDTEAEAPILWTPNAKSWLIGKDPDAGRDGGQEENRVIEDEMIGWHRFNGHEFEQTLEIVKDREAWQTAVRGISELDMIERQHQTKGLTKY